MTIAASLPEPILETPRLRLRPLIASDAEPLHGCYGDPEAMRYWDFPASLDPAQTAERLSQSLRTDPKWHAAWAVLLKDGEQFLGMVNYHHREPWYQRLEVGYILARPYWRRGFMSEAMLAFLGHCFAGLGTHRVEATIEPENVDSIRLVERLGFRREGLLRDRLLVDGTYRSVLMFALLEGEWRTADTKA